MKKWTIPVLKDWLKYRRSCRHWESVDSKSCNKITLGFASRSYISMKIIHGPWRKAWRLIAVFRGRHRRPKLCESIGDYWRKQRPCAAVGFSCNLACWICPWNWKARLNLVAALSELCRWNICRSATQTPGRLHSVSRAAYWNLWCSPMGFKFKTEYRPISNVDLTDFRSTNIINSNYEALLHGSINWNRNSFIYDVAVRWPNNGLLHSNIMLRSVEKVWITFAANRLEENKFSFSIMQRNKASKQNESEKRWASLCWGRRVHMMTRESSA